MYYFKICFYTEILFLCGVPDGATKETEKSKEDKKREAAGAVARKEIGNIKAFK
jgi:hypothetical protein